MYVYVPVYVCVCVCTGVCVCMCVCMYICVYACVHARLGVCVCVCGYMHACVGRETEEKSFTNLCKFYVNLSLVLSMLVSIMFLNMASVVLSLLCSACGKVCCSEVMGRDWFGK